MLEAVRTSLRQDAFSATLAATLPRSGLDGVEADLRRLVGRVLPLCRHNRAVYAPFYDDMIAHL